MSGLYLHVPFCRTVCPYCDFAVSRDRPDQHAAVVGALVAALAADPPPFTVGTIYLGGGTPSRLRNADVAALLEAAGAAAAREVTIEANPEDLTRERLLAWRDAGVTRLSVGVQRLHAAHLRRLGRARSAEAVAALPPLLQAWRALGGSASVDLIYGLPDDTADAFAAEVAAVLRWPVDHLSAYALTVESSTPLARAVARGTLRPAVPEVVAASYERLVDAVEAAGWLAYEVSNFCRPGHASQHNRGYWQGLPYMGYGPGAVSTVAAGHGTLRFTRHRALADWLREPASRPVAEALTPEQRRSERLFLGLRSDIGVPRAWWDAWLSGTAAATAAAVRDAGLVDVGRDTVLMPPRRRLLADELAARWPDSIGPDAVAMLD